MAILVAIVLVVIFSYIFDHVRYWRRLDGFEFRALEFSEMYDLIASKVINGDSEDPEIDEFEFEGEYYYILVKKGDLNEFYRQIGIAIKDVQKAYDIIGKRYLELMDDETEDRIESLHRVVDNIALIIRYQSWLRGIK